MTLADDTQIEEASSQMQSTTTEDVAAAVAPEEVHFGKNKMPWSARLGIAWLVFIVGAAIYAKLDQLFGQALPLQDPFYQGNLFGTASRTETPSTAHFLGTDVLSRDTFSRIVHGGWVSLVVAGVAALFGIFVGGILGSFVGYVKGRWESVIMSGIDVILAFPPLILLLAMVSIYQVRSLALISLVIGILSIPAYTRIARANALAISNREFVHAAQAIGTKKATILFREILPNVFPALIAYALVQSAYVIVLEGTLSFLGLSVQLPEPTWGNMINEGRSEIRQTILPVLWPSLALTFTVLSMNQLGDYLQRRAAIRSSAL
jgi:peptide/nickel transport system permease protein